MVIAWTVVGLTVFFSLLWVLGWIIRELSIAPSLARDATLDEAARALSDYVQASFAATRQLIEQLHPHFVRRGLVISKVSFDRHLTALNWHYWDGSRCLIVLIGAAAALVFLSLARDGNPYVELALCGSISLWILCGCLLLWNFGRTTQLAGLAALAAAPQRLLAIFRPPRDFTEE